MRSLILVAGLAVLAAPVAAQQADSSKTMKHDSGMHMQHMQHEDADQAVAGGGHLPEGWATRTDRNASPANDKFETMGSGFHVTSGPAAIYYRATDAVEGPFHTLASFTQTKEPKHPEAYGLFYAGRDLQGANQQYTYFEVRGDGKYLVKGRQGDSTYTIQDWTANPAVHAAGDDGTATNKLEIDAKSQPGKVRFLANGQEVYSMAAKPDDLKGIVGLRVNHNLSVHIAGFAVHK